MHALCHDEEHYRLILCNSYPLCVYLQSIDSTRSRRTHTQSSDNETRSTEVVIDYKPAFISVDKARQAKALHLLI